MDFLNLIWLIPMYPLAGSLLMLLFGRKLEHGHKNGIISMICPGLVGVAFLHAIGAVIQLTSTPNHFYEKVLYTWVAGLPFHMSSGALARFSADFGYMLDPLSSVMVLVVTGVGFLIHIYSIGYMGHEGGYYRFFGYMNLFMFSMLTLVLADNYRDDVRWLGGRGALLLPPDRFLLPQQIGHRCRQESVRRQPHRRRRVHASACCYILVTFGTLNFRARHRDGRAKDTWRTDRL